LSTKSIKLRSFHEFVFFLFIQKFFLKKHVPPYQPYYVTNELEVDDMHMEKSKSVQAVPTINEFTELKHDLKSKTFVILIFSTKY
jgi:hypothetical protein